MKLKDTNRIIGQYQDHKDTTRFGNYGIRELKACNMFYNAVVRGDVFQELFAVDEIIRLRTVVTNQARKGTTDNGNEATEVR